MVVLGARVTSMMLAYCKSVGRVAMAGDGEGKRRGEGSRGEQSGRFSSSTRQGIEL